MLSAITTLVRTEMEAQGCPIPVSYGPERGGARSIVSRVVIEREHGVDEPIRAPRTWPVNPRQFGVRETACVIRIFASSTISGATVRNHEALADALADLIHVAMSKVVQQEKQQVTWRSARMLLPEELEAAGLLTWPGVVYELRCSIDRGVMDRTWALANKDEWDVDDGSIRSTTTVSGAEACGPPTP